MSLRQGLIKRKLYLATRFFWGEFESKMIDRVIIPWIIAQWFITVHNSGRTEEVVGDNPLPRTH
jgi:hypothetical protein